MENDTMTLIFWLLCFTP